MPRLRVPTLVGPTLALALGAPLGAGCAAAPPPPPPSAVVVPAAPQGEAALDEAARLLADGAELPRAAELLAAAPPGGARREVLLGQLAELSGDDAAAEAAYARALAIAEDDDVRLRRALVLERLGRGDEVRPELERLRAQAARPAEPSAARRLRPLRPSSR